MNSDRQETSIDKVHSNWSGKCQPRDRKSNWNRNGNWIEIEPLAMQLPCLRGGSNKIRHRINLNTMQCRLSKQMWLQLKSALSEPKRKASSLPKSFDWLTKSRQIYGSIIPLSFPFFCGLIKPHLFKLPTGEWQALQIVTH